MFFFAFNFQLRFHCLSLAVLKDLLSLPFWKQLCISKQTPPFCICFHSNKNTYYGSWTKYTGIYNAH